MEAASKTEAVKAKLLALAERDGVPVIRENERQLLIRAAERIRPRRILEIGTAIGYSSLLLAEAFPEAEIDTLEIDEKRWETAKKAHEEAGVSRRIHCHLGDAAQILPALSGPYDFVYLDGPKGQYLRELLEIEPKLAEKAVIAADNVLFRGLVRQEGPVPHRYRTLVMRLREYIAYTEKHYETVIYEEGDGLAVSVRSEDRKEAFSEGLLYRKECHE